MKRLKLLLFIILLTSGLMSLAQITPKVNQEAKPKQKKVNQATEITEPPTTEFLTLKVETDLDCLFKIDNEDKYEIKSGDIKKIRLKKGEYKFDIISTENSKDTISRKYIVNEVNIDKIYSIKLSEKKNERIKVEEEEKERKAEIEREKMSLRNDSLQKIADENEKRREKQQKYQEWLNGHQTIYDNDNTYYTYVPITVRRGDEFELEVSNIKSEIKQIEIELPNQLQLATGESTRKIRRHRAISYNIRIPDDYNYSDINLSFIKKEYTKGKKVWLITWRSTMKYPLALISTVFFVSLEICILGLDNGSMWRACVKPAWRTNKKLKEMSHESYIEKIKLYNNK